MLRASVAAVDPYELVRRASLGLPERSIVVAAGKAAWGMAHAVFDAHVSHIVCGIGTGPRGAVGHVPPGFEWHDGEHPLPGASSERAGRRALEVARRAADEDVPLVVLLSGGASAILAVPAAGLTLSDKSATTGALLRAGVSIAELNAVRKHLSAVKGGRLGAIARRTVTLAISDVHGPIEDDPSTIGSGPTVVDSTTYADALGVLDRAAVRGEVPEAVLSHLAAGSAGELEETPKAGDPRLAKSEYRIIGNRHTAVAGAVSAAASRGYATHVVAAPTAGESREAGLAFAHAALALASRSARPCCVVGSGETTVRVRGSGRGGRNQEFALGAADSLDDWFRSTRRPVALASAGTDGIDGPTDAAGAIVDHTTMTRALAGRLDPARALRDNDTYAFFRDLGDLLVWGPTGTNVGDVHVVLIG